MKWIKIKMPHFRLFPAPFSDPPPTTLVPRTLAVPSNVEQAWEYGLNARKENTVVVCLHSSASARSAGSKWKKNKGSDILSLSLRCCAL